MKIRIFVAIKIDEEALSKISEIRNNIILDNRNDLKWESNNKLHITLKFIGETDSAVLSDVIRKLKTVSSNHSKFDLRFSKFGIFKKNNSSIIWAGIKNNNNLTDLYNDINNSLKIYSKGKPAKYFTPHVTLLRNRRNREIKNLDKLLLVNISDIKFYINEFYLIKSELTPKGSIYTELEKFELT